MEFVREPDGATGTAGDWLRARLTSDSWQRLRAAVAFAKRSGLRQLRPELDKFIADRQALLAVGIDHRGTTVEALQDFLELTDGSSSRVTVFHNESLSSTFHPKVYLFESDTHADLLVGSSNLTAGGLDTNYEASVAVRLDLSDSDDRAFYDVTSYALDAWMDTNSDFVEQLTEQLLADLITGGYVVPENLSPAVPDAVDDSGPTKSGEQEHPKSEGRVPIFGRRTLSPPRRAPRQSGVPADVEATAEAAAAGAGQPTPAPIWTRTGHGFLMTLQNTDVGVGQTTPGTSRRSPEIFIPLEARDADPGF